MCSLTMKHTRVVSTKCTPGFACRGAKNRNHIDGLVQERSNLIANALELRLSCTNPSILWRWQTLLLCSSYWMMFCNSIQNHEQWHESIIVQVNQVLFICTVRPYKTYSLTGDTSLALLDGASIPNMKFQGDIRKDLISEKKGEFGVWRH